MLGRTLRVQGTLALLHLEAGVAPHSLLLSLMAAVQDEM